MRQVKGGGMQDVVTNVGRHMFHRVAAIPRQNTVFPISSVITFQ